MRYGLLRTFSGLIPVTVEHSTTAQLTRRAIVFRKVTSGRKIELTLVFHLRL